MIGDEELLVRELEGLLERFRDALVERHPADEGGHAVHFLPPRDIALEVARHRGAEPLQHLVGLVALLLGVDHVRLREDAAAARYLGGALRGEDEIPDILYLEPEAVRLLVHE